MRICRKVVTVLPGLSAVIFLPDDTVKTGYSRPMLLQNVMGTPLLSWLVDSMSAGGVERFFLVCRPQLKEAACACFPKDVELVCAQENQTADQMHVFLSTADELETDVIVVTGPCVLLPYAAEDCQFDTPPEASPMVCVSREALMGALDDSFDFLSFLKEQGIPYTDRDGVYAVADLAELTDWQPVLNRAKLYRLAESGVEIWDYSNTYVDADVSVAPGAVLLPGTILRGRTVVEENCVLGPNAYLEDAKLGPGTRVNSSQIFRSSTGMGCHIGPYACVRPGCTLGANVKVGGYVEVKNAKLQDGVKIPHNAYVADAKVGENAKIGWGAVTVNHDRAQRNPINIENDAYIGANATLVAPITLGQGAYVAAGSVVGDDIPAMALAIARARLTVKKDWSGKHKKKAEEP